MVTEGRSSCEAAICVCEHQILGWKPDFSKKKRFVKKGLRGRVLPSPISGFVCDYCAGWSWTGWGWGIS